MAYMKRINISELKNSLSAVLGQVRSGFSFIVYDRNTPIARITAISTFDRVGAGQRQEEEGEEAILVLDQLERGGIIARGKGEYSKKIISPPPKSTGPSDVLQALLADRYE